jgi:hypothetical protein
MQDVWKKTWFIGLVYTLVAVGVSAQKLAAGWLPNGYTAYENYRIFKTSFTQLAAQANPYAGIPDGPWDLFKYSPAFALAMAPFSVLPDWLGLPLWNLLNALPLLYVLLRLPVLTQSQRVFCCWFVLPELITSLQNSQSNGLTAAAILLAFLAFEQQRPIWAAGWVVASAFIKIFGIFAAVPGLLYPQRTAFAGSLFLWSVGLLFVPLVLMSPLHLAQVYAWWGQLLWADQAVSVGLSVQGWLQTWFGWTPSKTLITLAGLSIFMASVLAAGPAARQAPYYRILAWASLLLWVVIFNHKAESPTYIIAMTGVALWYGSSEKKTWEKALCWTAFVLTSLSPTDIFPRGLREHWVQPYVLKALPCIVIWLVISVRLFQGWKYGGGTKIPEEGAA